MSMLLRMPDAGAGEESPAVAELRPIVTFPRDAVLEIQHMAAAFGVSERTIERQDFPCFFIGRQPRWIWGQVLDECTRRAAKLAAGEGTGVLPMRRRRRRSRS